MTTDIAPLADRKEYAVDLAKSDMLPAHLKGKPANILWTMEMADALGLTLAQAVNGVAVIGNKPSLLSETMRALVLTAGHFFRVDEQTADSCTVSVARKEWPDDVQRFKYTMEDAKRAGLSGNANYQKNPGSMLLARATSRACKAVFPDVIQGFAMREDIEHQHPGQPTPPPIPARATRPEPPAGVDTATGEIVDGEVVEDEPTPDMDGIAMHAATADLDELRDMWTLWHGTARWPEIEPLIAERRAQLEAG